MASLIPVIDNVINRIEEEQSNSKFWTQSDKGAIKIEHILFKHFLEEHGFYKFNLIKLKKRNLNS